MTQTPVNDTEGNPPDLLDQLARGVRQGVAEPGERVTAQCRLHGPTVHWILYSENAELSCV